MQPEDPQEPDPRRMVAVGLAVIAMLVAGGLLIVHKLREMSELQDCAMQGRSNCATIDGD